MFYKIKTLRLFILSIGFLGFIAPYTFAQGTTSLWKVTAEGSDRTIYLGGSIHILGEDDHPLPPSRTECL